MLLGPAADLGEIKSVIVLIPDVEQEGQDRSLVRADGFGVKLYGVGGFEILGESVVTDKVSGDFETFGESSPGLGRGHLRGPF